MSVVEQEVLKRAILDYIKYGKKDILVTLTGDQLEIIVVALMNHYIEMTRKNPNESHHYLHQIIEKIREATDPVKKETGADRLANL